LYYSIILNYRIREIKVRRRKLEHREYVKNK